VPSPNSWWAGADPAKIEPFSAVVLHHTAMETDAECVDTFLDPGSRVSSHFLVGTDGRLWQFVSLEDRAWHAGSSRLHGRWALNRTSVGIEITGNGNVHPFTPAQLATTARLVGVLIAMYDLPIPWVVGHEHVAPDRKNDPGRLFPWNDILREALETARRLAPETGGTR
jgi:N-acetylmuramoyl-L-alanine amidase